MKRNDKFSKMISIIAGAVVCVMLGVAIGNVSAPLTMAQAESSDVTVGSIDSDYVSPGIAVYQKCQASVVGVISNNETWNRSTGSVEKSKIGEGSGVVISGDGYIITNNHVVESGSSFQIATYDGEKYDAKLVGTDSGTDIAVLKVEGVSLPAIEIGSSSDLQVGETIFALGNPGGTYLASTLTQGMVSALERSLNNSFTRTVKTIQHDAAINPGNSGGALLNTKGQLVGINTLKLVGTSSSYGYSTSSISYEGLGFAIPIDLIMPLAEQIIEFGEVRRPAMGVTVGSFYGPDEPISNYPPASVVVTTVDEGSPAEESGVKPYDFITEINGTRVTNLAELTAIVDECKEGDTVTLTVVRYKNTDYIKNLLYYASNYGSVYGSDSSSSIFGSGYGSSGRLEYDELTIDVTLKILN